MPGDGIAQPQGFGERSKLGGVLGAAEDRVTGDVEGDGVSAAPRGRDCLESGVDALPGSELGDGEQPQRPAVFTAVRLAGLDPVVKPPHPRQVSVAGRDRRRPRHGRGGRRCGGGDSQRHAGGEAGRPVADDVVQPDADASAGGGDRGGEGVGLHAVGDHRQFSAAAHPFEDGRHPAGDAQTEPGCLACGHHPRRLVVTKHREGDHAGAGIGEQVGALAVGQHQHLVDTRPPPQVGRQHQLGTTGDGRVRDKQGHVRGLTGAAPIGA